jgi:hypothetical protein
MISIRDFVASSLSERSTGQILGSGGIVEAYTGVNRARNARKYRGLIGS